MRPVYHPTVDEMQLSTIFYALSDPVRLQIVRNLAGRAECSCGEFGVDVAKSTLSHHLKVLRESGLIRTRADGTQRFVSLRLDEVSGKFPGLLDAAIAALRKQEA